MRTPVGDLLHRCNLQNQLWNAVLHLRNNVLFHPSLREFTSSVDICRLNKYDNPDFVYVRHDGTILKRLFSAFSYRPTVVATLPVPNLFSYNPYSQNMRPTVTAIPMINVRIMHGTYRNPDGTMKVLTLSDSLSQTNRFIEGTNLVDRLTNVMFSREVLVFYVDRRAYVYANNNTLTNLARLPTSVAGFERINETVIDYEKTININSGNQTFEIRAVICAELKEITTDGPKYVIGSSAYVMRNKNNPTTRVYRKYSPNNVKQPIIGIRPAEEEVNEQIMNKQGIIFIYVNDKHTDQDDYIF
jgi:hypothetical protein